MKTTNPTAQKALATIADMAQNGVKNMAAITRILSVVYAPENIGFVAIHTKQTLQAAGLENEAMVLDAALYAVLDADGFTLSAEMQAQGLSYLRKIAARKDSPMSWRENEALKDGAVIRWASTYHVYNPKTGEDIGVLPVFDVENTHNVESFQYYIGRTGKPEICG